MGKLLAGKLWTLDVGPYEQIVVQDFPTVEDRVLKKFSNDAKDLYRLCIAVTTGTQRLIIQMSDFNYICKVRQLVGYLVGAFNKVSIK